MLDCFWLLDGKAEWSTKKLVGGQNAYRVYADEAATLDLTGGGHWKTLKDWPHVQLPSHANPFASLTVLDVDAAMEAGFGG